MRVNERLTLSRVDLIPPWRMVGRPCRTTDPSCRRHASSMTRKPRRPRRGYPGPRALNRIEVPALDDFALCAQIIEAGMTGGSLATYSVEHSARLWSAGCRRAGRTIGAAECDGVDGPQPRGVDGGQAEPARGGGRDPVQPAVRHRHRDGPGARALLGAVPSQRPGADAADPAAGGDRIPAADRVRAQGTGRGASWPIISASSSRSAGPARRWPAA